MTMGCRTKARLRAVTLRHSWGCHQAAGRRIFDLLKAPSQWIHRCFFCLLLPVAVTRRVVDLADTAIIKLA